MKKKSWYAIELVHFYENAAHDLASSGMPYDMSPDEDAEFERMIWLADIWESISSLRRKWYS